MKITDILQAYHTMPACDRLDLICRMLRHCIPYEMYFLGTILLDGARSHFKSYISKIETSANRVNYYTTMKDAGLTHEVCDKLCCALAVLHADNRPVAEIIFKILNDSRVLDQFEEANDLRVMQDLRLLYVMAVNHPALSFNQRQHLMYTYLQRMDMVFVEKSKYSFSGSFSNSIEQTLSCEFDSGRYRPEGHLGEISPDAYIVCCEVHSVYKRTTDKRYAYMIQVDWSDGVSSMVRRTYGDFFSFQTKLLDLFPEEGGQKGKKHPRLIPFLPGKTYSKFLKNKEVAEKRLPELHRYSRELTSLPEHVTRSPHVLDFFKPKPTDMKEDYPAFHKITTLYDLIESGKVRSRVFSEPMKGSCSPAPSPLPNRSSPLKRAMQNSGTASSESSSSPRISHTLPPSTSTQQVGEELTSVIPRRPTYPLSRQLQSEMSAFTPVGQTALSEDDHASSITLTASVVSIPGSGTTSQTTPTLIQTTPTLTSTTPTNSSSISFVFSSANEACPSSTPVLLTSSEAHPSFIPALASNEAHPGSIPVLSTNEMHPGSTPVLTSNETCPGSISVLTTNEMRPGSIPASVSHALSNGGVFSVNHAYQHLATGCVNQDCVSRDTVVNGSNGMMMLSVTSAHNLWPHPIVGVEAPPSAIMCVCGGGVGGVIPSPHQSSISPTQHITSPTSALSSPILSSNLSPSLAPPMSPSPPHSGASTPRGGGVAYPQQIIYPPYSPIYFYGSSPLPSPLPSPKTSSKWHGSYSSVHHGGIEYDTLLKWLKSLRLHKYHPIFENITYEEFCVMTMEDLECKSMTTGAAKKLLKKLDELKKSNFVGFRDMPFNGTMARKPSTCSLPAALLMEQGLTPSSSYDRFSPTGSTCSLDKYGSNTAAGGGGVGRGANSVYSKRNLAAKKRCSSTSEPVTNGSSFHCVGAPGSGVPGGGGTSSVGAPGSGVPGGGVPPGGGGGTSSAGAPGSGVPPGGGGGTSSVGAPGSGVAGGGVPPGGGGGTSSVGAPGSGVPGGGGSSSVGVSDTAILKVIPSSLNKPDTNSSSSSHSSGVVVDSHQQDAVPRLHPSKISSHSSTNSSLSESRHVPVWADVGGEGVGVVNKPDWAVMTNTNGESHSGTGIGSSVNAHIVTSDPSVTLGYQIQSPSRSSISAPHTPLQGYHHTHHIVTKRNSPALEAINDSAPQIIIPQPLHPSTGHNQMGGVNANWTTPIKPYHLPSTVRGQGQRSLYPSPYHHNASVNGLIRTAPQNRVQNFYVQTSSGAIVGHPANQVATTPPCICYNCGKRGHLGNTCPGITMDTDNAATFHKQLERLVNASQPARRTH